MNSQAQLKSVMENALKLARFDARERRKTMPFIKTEPKETRSHESSWSLQQLLKMNKSGLRALIRADPDLAHHLITQKNGNMTKEEIKQQNWKSR
jgi:hypothetical protein